MKIAADGTGGRGAPPAGHAAAARLLTSVKVRVGCSGWQYKHWRGTFYPNALPASQWFAYYAARFDTVEINNTFYRLPEATTFAAWKAQAPRGFLYAVKASRWLTHMKKLKEPRQPLNRLFSRARSLESHLGPVLYQLPPRWPINVERLATFVRSLPARRRHAIEFRDPSWYREDVLELLQSHRVALCLHDMAGSATGRLAVGGFVYVRFHGPARYSGRYSDAAIDDWAAWLTTRIRKGEPVFAFFNNDAGGQAPRDAMRLRERLGG